MNENYQKKLDSILENIDYEGRIPRLLLHSCCAPCSSYVLEYLSNFFEITIYYYNPNISPFEEYEKRKAEQKKFISKLKTKHKMDFLESNYDDYIFKEISKGLEEVKEGGSRCFKCYEFRIRSTAGKAIEGSYDYFTTTLSISPHKNASKINEIGSKLQEELSIKYLYADFKKKNGYKRSIELSGEYNLYRQNYCGCIYSKRT